MSAPETHTEGCNRSMSYRPQGGYRGKERVDVTSVYLATLACYPRATAQPRRVSVWDTSGWKWACDCGATSWVILDLFRD